MTRTPHKNLFRVNLFILSPLTLFFTVVSISGDSPPRYIPTENIAVACGALTNSTEPNGRNWVADIDSSLFTLRQRKNNASVTSSAQKPSVASTVPYSTARISTSEFTYVFRLTAGQKFIRLYFNPSSYQNFESSKAFFSVEANQFTLLSNTSGYFPDTTKKEFCITVEEDEDQTLNITFAPSISPANSYAFINGIEIVSMPANLYYVSATEPQGFSFVGYPEKVYPLENSTALETIHRLNVGGSSISPDGDTGLFRSWSQDDKYVSIAGALPVNQSIELRFTKIRNYIAPDAVYNTARSMGNKASTNDHYNLTWALPVDSGFTYMVRLHFCEFQSKITKRSEREFRIFMENQTAEEYADVIGWSGGNGVPVYRDYAVQVVSSETEKKQNLSVALHPGLKTRTRYSDAILNGLEVFKLSGFNGNLAGPNAEPTQPPAAPSITPLTKRENKRTTALVAAICGGVVLLSVITGLLIFRRRRWWKNLGSSHGELSWWRSLPYIALRPTKTGRSLLPSAVCRRFSLAEIRAATNNFDGVSIVGSGGFGDVYKGYVDGGATAVAIKRLKPGSKQGAHEFSTEIEMLSQLRHLHLVSLIGYCNEGHEMILIYEYMSRGSLRDHLYNTYNPPLSWNQRLRICIGAAKGLHYLHAGATRMIIHRDVKTTNILLDDKWVAKVSDFGLSKKNPNNIPNSHISTAVKGSFGYLDPEYYRRQQLTEKSDVYSFGVVLFEVLCARLPLDKTLEREQVGLAWWAQVCYHKGTLDQIVDPHLTGRIAPECLKKYGEIAVSCLHDEGIQRPSMNDVVWALEFALQLQESAWEIIELRGSQKEFKDNDAFLFNGEDEGSIGGGRVSSNGGTLMTTSETNFTSSGCTNDRVSSDSVFSEIMETRAR